jgi:hypothetical protein
MFPVYSQIQPQKYCLLPILSVFVNIPDSNSRFSVNKYAFIIHCTHPTMIVLRRFVRNAIRSAAAVSTAAVLDVLDGVLPIYHLLCF